MTDLTDNKIPFGLLTPEEQEHLRNWPHGVEMYCADNKWEDCKVPTWVKSLTYRQKPKPETVVKYHFLNPKAAEHGGYESIKKARKASPYRPTYILRVETCAKTGQLISAKNVEVGDGWLLWSSAANAAPPSQN